MSERFQEALFSLEPLRPDWGFEEELSRTGYKVICGIDDAGRGPLAGPVAAACVIFHRKLSLPGLMDSKAISSVKRDMLFEKIISSKDISFAVGMSSVEEIDALNILNATHLAMRRALESLDVQPDALLIDGNIPLRGVQCFQKTVVKGDARCRSISAASILAKVTRDRWMKECSALYPGYEFDVHKGYGTRKHFELLEKYGPCPLHRKSFAPVRRLQSQ
ncbi:MAG: ribonuclease HII [Candidatus Aureabacteria bacterium]|nr:ribonuclease HII [Candidatus Auribacterota bacterium]